MGPVFVSLRGIVRLVLSGAARRRWSFVDMQWCCLTSTHFPRDSASCQADALRTVSWNRLPGFADKLHCAMGSKGFILLLSVAFTHLVGIYLFTRGFLLSRLSLTDHSDCSDLANPCTLAPVRSRAVFLIIDALRFDFISADPPTPHSPFHHNILTLPRELTASQPRNSFIFNAYADPPTTTLQRIKGLTTGSLPTFVDIGNNFGGSSIAEDSLIQQIQSAGKKVRRS